MLNYSFYTRKKKGLTSEKGVTLITLIVMIIIMLILLGVGTKIIIDGKIIGATEKTVNATNNKIGQEQIRVDYLMGELTTIEQSKCTHEWTDDTIIKQANCTEKGSKKIICSKCEKIEIVEIKKLPHKFVKGRCTVCQGDLILGAYVNGYDPSIGENNEEITTRYISQGAKTGGTYDIDGTFDGSKGNGYKNQTFQVASINKWRILNQDDSGRIMIMPADSILTIENQKLYLRGQAGFKNAVNELHNICSIYGQGKYADKTLFVLGNETTKTSGARSVQLDDFGKINENGCRTIMISKQLNEEDNKYYIYKNGVNTNNQVRSSNNFYWDIENKEWKEFQEGEENAIQFAVLDVEGEKFSTLLENAIRRKANGEYDRYWIAYQYFQEKNGALSWAVGQMDGSRICLDSGWAYTEIAPATDWNGVRNFAIKPVVYLRSSVNLVEDDTGGYTIVE